MRGNKRPASVLIGKPQPSIEGHGYVCPFQIIGVGNQKTLIGHGRDSIHALQTALVLLGSNLHNLNEELGGRLFWEGRELGFR